MNLEHLERLALAGESETVEFKRSTAEANTAARTICAMLNGHRGGIVLFGINDDGRIVGQPVGDQTHDRIRAEIRKIEPPVVPDLEAIQVSPTHAVLAVSVPGGTGLYRYDGTPYERFGPTTSAMSEHQFQRLLMEHFHATTRWENRQSPLSIDDLDHQEVAITVAEAVRIGRLNEPGSREIIPMLNGLQLLKDGQMLHAAVVLFGRSDRMFAMYPQCGLRMARFRGTDKTEFSDNRQVFGNAFSLYQQAQQFFREHLPIAGRIEGFYRIDTPKYPPDAFREALVNAICHRDYSDGSGAVDLAIYDDRLEITSTGGLHFGITTDQLKGDHQSRPWNPLVAQAFYMRGTIERWGRGTNRIVDWTIDGGLPEPDFIDTRMAFTVRFRAAQTNSPTPVPKPSGISELQQAILDVLESTGPAPLRVVAEHLRLVYTRDQVRRGLRTLQDRNLVSRSGVTSSSLWEITATGPD